MTTRPTFWLLAAVVSLITTSCGTRESENTDPLAYPEVEQETAYIPTYSKSVLGGWPKGRALDPHDISRVRLGEQVHAYHVGRLPSKDRQEMHEAHTVYRLEQNSKWDTRLPATPMESRGIVLGIIDPARNAVPADTLVTQEREALLAKSRQLELTITRLNGLQADLEKRRSQYDEAMQTSQELKLQLAKITQEHAAASQQLKQASERIEELEEASRFLDKMNIQGSGSSSSKKK